MLPVTTTCRNPAHLSNALGAEGRGSPRAQTPVGFGACRRAAALCEAFSSRARGARGRHAAACQRREQRARCRQRPTCCQTSWLVSLAAFRLRFDADHARKRLREQAAASACAAAAASPSGTRRRRAETHQDRRRVRPSLSRAQASSAALDARLCGHLSTVHDRDHQRLRPHGRSHARSRQGLRAEEVSLTQDGELQGSMGSVVIDSLALVGLRPSGDWLLSHGALRQAQPELYAVDNARVAVMLASTGPRRCG